MNDEGDSQVRCDTVLIAARAGADVPTLRERLVAEMVAPLRLELSRTRFVWLEAPEGAEDLPPAEEEWLAGVLPAAEPKLIISAGETAFRALAVMRSWEPRPKVERYSSLYGPAYGKSGSIQPGRRAARWIALAHPSSLKPFRVRAPTDAAPCAAGWTILHSRWKHDHPDGVHSLPPMLLRSRPPGAHVPEGPHRRLHIARAEIFEQPGFGKTLEVVFTAHDEAHRDDVARGSFPLGGRGLAALIAAALGERPAPAAVDAALLERLHTARVIADTFHGAAGKQIAWVRNVRPWPFSGRRSAREVLQEPERKKDEAHGAEAKAHEKEAPLLG